MRLLVFYGRIRKQYWDPREGRWGPLCTAYRYSPSQKRPVHRIWTWLEDGRDVQEGLVE